MGSFSFWQRWLLVVGLVVTVFGILMALISGTALFDLFNRQVDPVFWRSIPVEDATRQFQHWLYGIWGATIAGWGVFLTYIVRYPFSRRERWTWNCLALGVLVWFALDTSLSVFYQVYFNVIFNTVLLLLVGLPLMSTRQHFVE